MSATSDVKLPLQIKKEIRDAEPAKTAALKDLEASLGYPVTFNWSVEAAWKALEGSSSQSDLINAVNNSYLPAVIECLIRETKDDLAKEQFNKLFTAKNINLVIEPEGWEYDSEKKSLVSWSGYNGIRLVDGNLEIFFPKNYFWTNVDHISNAKFATLLKYAEGDLPLAIRQQIRDTADQRKAATDRIAKMLGLDKVEWDVTADAKAIVARGDKDYELDISPMIQYVESLAGLVEKKCSDDLVKEAVVDALSGKKVGFKVVDDLEKLDGQQMHSSYNGVQFKDGALYAVTTPGYWWTNVSQVEDFDIISLF